MCRNEVFPPVPFYITRACSGFPLTLGVLLQGIVAAATAKGVRSANVRARAAREVMVLLGVLKQIGPVRVELYPLLHTTARRMGICRTSACTRTGLLLAFLARQFSWHEVFAYFSVHRSSTASL